MDGTLDPAPFLEMPKPLLSMIVIVFLMKAVKMSPIPNWLIPWLAFIFGGLGYSLVNGFTRYNIVIGLLVGGASVGLHQAYKQTATIKRKTTMKRNIGKLLSMITMLAMTFLFAGCSGCASTGSGGTGIKFDPAQAAVAIRMVATSGTEFGLLQDPAMRPYLQTAVTALNGLTSTNGFSPDQVRATLENLQVEGEVKPEYVLAIDAAIGLYDTFASQIVANGLNQQQYLGPILAAFRDGIQTGLGADNMKGRKIRRNK